MTKPHMTRFAYTYKCMCWTSAKQINFVLTLDINWKLFDVYCDNKACIRTN